MAVLNRRDDGDDAVLNRARGRGRWDRRSTDEARRQETRRLVLDATARVVASRGGTATAAAIIELSGIGRNTFYEHFEGVSAAVSEVLREHVTELGAALRAQTSPVRTPHERLRALSSAWLLQTARRPFAMAILLDTPAESRGLVLAELETEVRAALELARSAGTVAVEVEPLRLACVVGAFVGAASLLARTPGTDARSAAETLTDVTLRMFR